MPEKRPRRKPQDGRDRSQSTRSTQPRRRGPADCDVQLAALMTVAEVAKALRRHPEVIRDWIRADRLHGVKVGRDWVVSKSELARFRKDEPERRKR